jgi:hypothetical protein
VLLVVVATVWFWVAVVVAALVLFARAPWQRAFRR